MSHERYWHYRVVDTTSGAIYSGIRWGATRKAVKRVLRADYGRIQILSLR